ncbi:hypothetical protein CDQ84_09395 [Clostridium thermosuccinogenes]|uniref:HTH araC/xylS-type domain-containing protein n=1 Tax=Clostridium thermosuccinogenes TaxID=84032 RepID=A0A2K2FEG8_9CLOT|nr:AraC family transcriptional regulator [Pseudoclostridium thermosuccinogenes]AUS98219.1 hypothetical protein CDO33_18220 [Pseudoclostridium thermosuccinogenes]PNT97167.1 hypothetical protein CDQ85_09245 [Pseudoclostridium thermosuccinogenes]PNT99059.1 hypothetical protein CDQ84_09395 [Pseudoclostridium thermosuccinogenes]
MVGFGKNSKLVISKTLTKMLISYFIIIILSISLISIVLYQRFSKATIEGIQNNIEESLIQNMNQLELIRGQAYSIGLQLINDSDIVDSLYWNEIDEMVRYKATRKLNQVKNSNSMIHSIYAYNSITKQFVSSLGSSGLSSLDDEMRKLTEDYREGNKLKFIPLKYTNRSPSGSTKTEYIITFIFVDSSQEYIKSENTGNDLLESALIINLNAEYIQKAFTQSYTSTSNSIFLLDKTGEVICDSDFKYFDQNISDKKYIRDILESNKNSGYMIREDEGRQYLITYSSSDKFPFLFVSKADYNLLLQEIYSLKASIIFVCGLIGVVCITVAILAAYNVYLPYGKLVRNVQWQLKAEADSLETQRTYNEIEYLSEAFTNIIKKSNELANSIRENVPMLRKMFLKELLLGQVSSSEVSKKIKELGLSIVQEKSCVILFSIDGYMSLTGIENRIEIAREKTKAEKIIRDAFLQYNGVEIVDMEEDSIALILNVNTLEEYEERIAQSLKSVQMKINENLEISVSIAKGALVGILEDIHVSYANARNLMKYRFVYGYGSLIDNNMMKNNSKDNCVAINKYRKKIIQAIKICDEKQMKSDMDEIILLIKDGQYDYIRLMINQLVLDIMMAVQSILNSDSEEMDFSNIYANLNSNDTLDSAKEWLITFCSGIIQRIEQKRDNRQKEMIDKVLAYIQVNYLRPDISAEMLSDMVNLTPGYFGKLFSDYTGKSVNEYIIELRMKKAKELLERNDLSVSDIAMQVGFSNQSYFTATFKKWNGITPNHYRNSCKKLGVEK